MSNRNDTYRQALKDASTALDALADEAFKAAASLSIAETGFDDYDAFAHRTAVDRHNGICAALLEIYGLLHEHDRKRQAGAA